MNEQDSLESDHTLSDLPTSSSDDSLHYFQGGPDEPKSLSILVDPDQIDPSVLKMLDHGIALDLFNISVEKPRTFFSSSTNLANSFAKLPESERRAWMDEAKKLRSQWWPNGSATARNLTIEPLTDPQHPPLPFPRFVSDPRCTVKVDALSSVLLGENPPPVHTLPLFFPAQIAQVCLDDPLVMVLHTLGFIPRIHSALLIINRVFDGELSRSGIREGTTTASFSSHLYPYLKPITRSLSDAGKEVTKPKPDMRTCTAKHQMKLRISLGQKWESNEPYVIYESVLTNMANELRTLSATRNQKLVDDYRTLVDRYNKSSPMLQSYGIPDDPSDILRDQLTIFTFDDRREYKRDYSSSPFSHQTIPFPFRTTASSSSSSDSTVHLQQCIVDIPLTKNTPILMVGYPSPSVDQPKMDVPDTLTFQYRSSDSTATITYHAIHTVYQRGFRHDERNFYSVVRNPKRRTLAAAMGGFVQYMHTLSEVEKEIDNPSLAFYVREDTVNQYTDGTLTLPRLFEPIPNKDRNQSATGTAPFASTTAHAHPSAARNPANDGSVSVGNHPTTVSTRNRTNGSPGNSVRANTNHHHETDPRKVDENRAIHDNPPPLPVFLSSGQPSSSAPVVTSASASSQTDGTSVQTTSNTTTSSDGTITVTYTTTIVIPPPKPSVTAPTVNGSSSYGASSPTPGNEKPNQTVR